MRKLYNVLFLFCILLNAVSCDANELDLLVKETENNDGTIISLVKSLSKEHYPDLEFSHSQGADQFGGYVFLCLDKGGQYMTTHIVILDAISLEPIGLLDTGETMHGNSLCFSNIYFSDDDVYPLLFVSNYYVLRITYNDGEWASETVSKISSDINAPSFVIDNDKQVLYLFNYNDNKGYNVDKSIYKHNIVRAFDMNKYNFKQNVYLPMSDAIDEFELPYYIIGQDITIKDGLVYWCNDDLSYSQFCLKEGGIWVLDFNAKQIIHNYPYTKQTRNENESIWSFNNDLFFATKGNNSLYIYKIISELPRAVVNGTSYPIQKEHYYLDNPKESATISNCLIERVIYSDSTMVLKKI